MITFLLYDLAAVAVTFLLVLSVNWWLGHDTSYSDLWTILVVSLITPIGIWLVITELLHTFKKYVALKDTVAVKGRKRPD